MSLPGTSSRWTRTTSRTRQFEGVQEIAVDVYGFQMRLAPIDADANVVLDTGGCHQRLYILADAVERSTSSACDDIVDAIVYVVLVVVVVSRKNG